MVLYIHLKHTLRRVLAAVCCLFLLAMPAVASADDYNVSATVPYPAPTQAAVIDPTLNGVTVADASQTITGSCELLSPEGFVAIWRGGVSIGSSVCNGSFSIPALLQQGQNVLIARSASASGLYGPDSSPITVTLNLPANVPPAVPPNSTIPTDAQTLTIDTNAGAASGLTAVTSTPFSALTNDNEVTISVTVAGGEAPYNLSLNWGDGTTEAHAIPVAGVYSYTHIYAESKAYIIHGQVQDANGAITQFNYAVVSLKKPAKGGIFSPLINQPPIDYVPEAILLGTVLLLACDYWLGWHVADRHYKKLLAAQQKRKQVRRRAQKRSKQKGSR